MTHANVQDDIRSDIESFIKRQFEGEIESVDVVDDCDDAGDRFLVITVAVQGSPAEFVRSKPPGLLRLLRNRLMAADVDAFPSINFVSSSSGIAA